MQVCPAHWRRARRRGNAVADCSDCGSAAIEARSNCAWVVRGVKIAMVGLGTAGACMLDSLARELAHRSDVSLTLYDSAATRWRGRAFQADCHSIIANAPVQAMSIRYGDAAHAEEWLRGHGQITANDTGERFLPRGIYGDYMADHAASLIDELRRRGWTVTFERAVATGLEPTESARPAIISNGRRAEFDCVVLCPGGSVLGNPYDLGGRPGYIADPYPTVAQLADIPTDTHVGVLGSGLTAVDVAVALRERGHAGPVTLYSRSGALPYVRRPGPAWSARHLTPEALTNLMRARGSLSMVDVERLFDREVEAWGGKPMGLFPRAPRRGTRDWLRWQLEQPHGASDLGTFIFQKSVPVIWQDIWYALRDVEKSRLYRSTALRSIMSRCCPMPRPNAEKVLEMLESGQLQVRGGLQTVTETRAGGFEIHMPAARSHVTHLVNGVTPAIYGVHPKASRLVESAVQHGLARRHHAGGLQVERDSSAVVGTQRTSRVFALGDLTRGAYFFIFGVPVLARRSADIAVAIRQLLSQDHSTRGAQPQPLLEGRPRRPPPFTTHHARTVLIRDELEKHRATESGLSGHSDGELASEVAQGSRAAAAELFRRHHPGALRFARTLAHDPSAAEDLAAEAFARTLSRVLAGTIPKSFPAYLITAVRNCAVTEIRRASEARRRGPEHARVSIQSLNVGEDFTSDLADRDLLYRAFNGLQPRHRIVLWRTAVEGRRLDEVGAELGINANAVAGVAYRARRAFRLNYEAGMRADAPATEPTAAEEQTKLRSERATHALR